MLPKTTARNAVKPVLNWCAMFAPIGASADPFPPSSNSPGSPRLTQNQVNMSPVYHGMQCIEELDVDDQNNTSILTTYAWGLDVAGNLDLADSPFLSIKGAGGVGGLLACRWNESLTQSRVFLYTYDGNGNGNVMRLVHRAYGYEVCEYTYGPYGETREATELPPTFTNNFRFSTNTPEGKPAGFPQTIPEELPETALAAEDGDLSLDEGVDLYDYGFRWYHARLGRWIKRDPIGEEGGRNLYQSICNLPSDVIDPFGLRDVNVQAEVIYQNWYLDFWQYLEKQEYGTYDILSTGSSIKRLQKFFGASYGLGGTVHSNGLDFSRFGSHGYEINTQLNNLGSDYVIGYMTADEDLPHWTELQKDERIHYNPPYCHQVIYNTARFYVSESANGTPDRVGLGVNLAGYGFKYDFTKGAMSFTLAQKPFGFGIGLSITPSQPPSTDPDVTDDPVASPIEYIDIELYISTVTRGGKDLVKTVVTVSGNEAEAQLLGLSRIYQPLGWEGTNYYRRDNNRWMLGWSESISTDKGYWTDRPLVVDNIAMQLGIQFPRPQGGT